MSQQEPTEIYVYQPYGSVSHQAHASAGRLWGVGGVSSLAEIKGLTPMEAAAVAKALNDLREQDNRDAA